MTGRRQARPILHGSGGPVPVGASVTGVSDSLPSRALVPLRRTAWVDARNGVAGDMLLGALVDAGASLSTVQRAVEAVIPGTVSLSSATVRRAGMRATKVDVRTVVEDQPHRHWTQIRSLLQEADLPDEVRADALVVFGRLAQAEGRAHGVDPEEVHFHEVGAWDSIADVVGVCASLHELAIDGLTAGPVTLGSGTIRAAHGVIPVPVPAVLELSTGWQVIGGGAGEMATPTGMALVVALATRCEDLPAMTVEVTGVGAGTRDPADRPNVVRVVIGSTEAGVDRAQEALERAVVLETNVDDLDPRVWPSVLAALMQAGASDAWLTPVLMKKGRPAHVLSALAAPSLVPPLRELVFRLVPTLGVREHVVVRTVLERLWHTVDVDGHPVRVKVGHRDGEILSATPEFEDVAALAGQLRRPVREVLTLALAAAVNSGLAVGRATPPDEGSTR